MIIASVAITAVWLTFVGWTSLWGWRELRGGLASGRYDGFKFTVIREQQPFQFFLASAALALNALLFPAVLVIGAIMLFETVIHP